MEVIKKLVTELKSGEYSKYDLFFEYYIPTEKEKYKEYANFNEKQKRIFRLFFAESLEKPSSLSMRFRVGKLFSVISEDEFEKAIAYFANIVDFVADVEIIAKAHLPIDKYVTIPPLPSVLEKENAMFGTSLLTGVRITFEHAKKDLKVVELNITPCLACGRADLRIVLALKKKIKFSSVDILSTLSEIEEYSKYFYKDRDEKK